jgi:hypothetical protein
MERAFVRLGQLNALKFEQAESEAKSAASGDRGSGLPANLPTSKIERSQKTPQAVEFTRTGP